MAVSLDLLLQATVPVLLSLMPGLLPWRVIAVIQPIHQDPETPLPNCLINISNIIKSESQNLLVQNQIPDFAHGNPYASVFQ